MLFVQGDLKLIRLKDGGMAVLGLIDHDCEEVEKNMVMNG